jgi:hypothetical protein
MTPTHFLRGVSTGPSEMPGESGQIVFQDGVNGTTLAAMTYFAIPGVQFIRRQIQELATLFGKTRRA